MADNFGLKIGLEGEKEFKKALSEINQSFKVLGSEMKVVSSQFDKNDNSVQALTARNQVLNKEIEAQRQKIETLRSALSNAAESFGENDRRTQNWQIQLNNATAALNDMERELDRNNTALDEAEREMDDVSDSADDMGEEIDDAADSADKSSGKFEKLGGVLKGIGAAMGAVAVAAGAAAVSLGKEVIAAYADYEQLVGGVDTLFKESSQELQTYAANAYKTAGMSANDYMETVTSFSASLIQSLGGDTEAAVKYADMAITDMADNANKMGTDISLIQNAYQGFAKQNYTMLDNLKLGYGGTKTEMERLLADAQAISGIEYDISSYSDVVEAIHVIQDGMGVAGATAAEAEHTISGSINSLQAALQNMLVGFGDADADMNMLCQNMVDALQNVIRNVTPVIENMVKVLPTVTDALLTAIADLLPTLLETVTELFSQLLNTILTLLPQLIPAAVDAIMTIVQALIDNLPLLVEAAVQLVVALVEGIGTALPQLIPAAVQAIVTIAQGLIENLSLILDAALQLIMGLVQGLLTAIPMLIEALPSIILAIVDFVISAIPQIIDAGIQLLTSLVSALPDIITAIVAAIPLIIEGIITAVIDSIPQLIDAGINLLVALIQALPEIITTIVGAIPQIVTSIVNALVGNIDKIIMAGVQLLVVLIQNLPKIIVEIVKAVPQIIAGLVSAFGKGVSQLASVGGNLVKGLWSGIQSLAGWLWDKVSGWISSIWDGICDFFGIASPSLRNFYETVPGKAGVADFGCDSGERIITLTCYIYPQKDFAALVSVLDEMSEWLDPTRGLKQLVLDEVPDRYFMARLSEAVDCERLIRSAGTFTLKFICPDPHAYALEDETYVISTEGEQDILRTIGNTTSEPVYSIQGIVALDTDSYISIITGGEELRVSGVLNEGETLIVDSSLVTAKVVDSTGATIRNGLPLLYELNFPTLEKGANMVVVSVSNATFTELKIEANSRWR